MSPSRSSLLAVGSALRTAFEGICATALYLVLYLLGYGGEAAGVCLGALTLGSVQLSARVQLLLAGGDLRRRPVARMTLLLATAAAFAYASGWGPILLPGLGLVVALHMRLSGARLWRPGLVLAFGFAAAGQTAIALGAAPTYLPETQVHLVALTTIVLSALIIRTIGSAGEDRDRAEAAILVSERRFRALVQDAGEVITVCNASAEILYVSPAVSNLLGLEPAGLMGAPLTPLIHSDDLQTVRAAFTSLAHRPGAITRAEGRMRHADGSYRWVECTLRNLSADPDVRGYVGIVRDIDERKATEQRLVYAASHDPLTGLVNRAEFGRVLDTACADGRAAVLFVDLDGFKQVNDRYGHDIGDALLLSAAELLSAAVPPGGTVGRFGGDEFGIVLAGQAADEAVTVAERVLERMSVPVQTLAGPLLLRASIGIATDGEQTAASAGVLLRAADLAMYQAKRSGAHTFRVASQTPVVA